jgi:hypothetical protein
LYQERTVSHRVVVPVLATAVLLSWGVAACYQDDVTALAGGLGSPDSVYILGTASMLVGDTTQIEAIVINAQHQPEPSPTVAWATLDPSVVSLTDSARMGKYAWVSSLAVGTGRVVATSGNLKDTLVITVAPDSTTAGLRARAQR